MSLPTDDKERKALPIFDGVLMYFPDAIAAVAAVSKAGNDQHNPGEPLHWARGKSMDQMNTAVRHMMDHGMGRSKDTDDTWHLAKAAWRILAQLQMAIETEREPLVVHEPEPTTSTYVPPKVSAIPGLKFDKDRYYRDDKPACNDRHSSLTPHRDGLFCTRHANHPGRHCAQDTEPKEWW